MITHEARSSTYRRLRTTLTLQERSGVGGFRWTPIVQRGWDTTVLCAKELRATAVLLQYPASFKATDDNVARLCHFAGAARRPDGVRLLWEPRGAGPDALARELCDELGMTHCRHRSCGAASPRTWPTTDCTGSAGAATSTPTTSRVRCARRLATPRRM